MKNIEITTIINRVKKLLIEASFTLPADIRQAVEAAIKIEEKPAARNILRMILENACAASAEKLPLCQDCGTVYVDIYIGNDICIKDSGLLAAGINRTVSEVYSDMYLRKSIVTDPLFDRKNTRSNTPAIINTFFLEKSGEIIIELSLKGGGSENCSYLFMINPSSGPERIEEILLDTVKKNATKCCPPVIAGIGIGSTASEAPRLARKAAYRNLALRNTDVRYASLEKEWLEKINRTGLGPQGLGGITTALACNIEYAPCHMATLPVAIFLGCHSTRRASSKISPP